MPRSRADCPVSRRSIAPLVVYDFDCVAYNLRVATPKRTRVLRIREAIEKDIVTGKLAPGTKLDEEVLAARYGASRTQIGRASCRERV